RRPAARGARADPARPHGQSARIRRRRLLPRLGPRRLHHRYDRPRRRRQLTRARMKLVTPGRLLALGVILFAVALTLYIAPSDEYIFLPDRAHPVAPLVTVQGGHDPLHGGVYFVDIVVRKATILEKLFGGLHDGADLYPASAVNPPGVGDQQRRRIDLQDMQ